jgi:hypothetical protein
MFGRRDQIGGNAAVPDDLDVHLVMDNYATHKAQLSRSATGPKIGAAWTNKDGRGFSLKLNLLPIGEADIVVREVESRSEGDARSCDSAAGSANDARRMNRPAIGLALVSLTSSTDKFLRPLAAAG